jgi:hypothetical protein
LPVCADTNAVDIKSIPTTSTRIRRLNILPPLNFYHLNLIKSSQK